MKIYYMGWVGFNNIGDELLLDLFKKKVKENKEDLYEVFPSYPNVKLDKIDPYDIIVLGGGSILVASYIDILYDAVKKNKRVIVWGSGYDLLERELMEKLDNDSSPAYIYPDEKEYKLNEIAKKAEFFGVRGPLTYTLLKKSFVDMSKVKISGDAGLLLEKGEIPEICPLYNIKKEDKFVGINFGTAYNRIFGKDENAVKKALVNVIDKLIDEGFKIYLYTMWDKDINAIGDLYDKFIDNEQVIIDTNLYKGEELVAILEKCIYTINFKLHANIISAAANTPFISLGYRFKCYDFARSLNCEELIVPTDSKSLQEDILMTIKGVLVNYEGIKEKMAQKIDEYKSIYDDFFKSI